jgi:hypothetical protein
MKDIQWHWQTSGGMVKNPTGNWCFRTDVEALATERDELAKACRAQSDVIAGLRSLTAFYRIGKRPTEKALDAAGRADDVEKMVVAALAARVKP